MNYKNILSIIVILILFRLSVTDASAQVAQKIGSNSYRINSNAVLELESTTKGFLPPRMTATQKTNVTLGTNDKGLIIYVTSLQENSTLPIGLQIWDGIQWINFVDTAALNTEISNAASDATTKSDAAKDAAIAAAATDATTKSDAAIAAAATDATTKSDAAIAAAATDATTKSDAAKDAAIAAAATDATAQVLVETNRATAAEALLTSEKEEKSNKSTDILTDSTSDSKFPSVKAVKTYVDVYSTFNAISSISASYTATKSDYTILCNNTGGPFQLSLPTASAVAGKIYVIRKTDESTNLLTITPALKLTESSEVSSLDYPKTMRVQSNGTNWYIVD